MSDQPFVERHSWHVQARVALALLEAVRDRDHPSEVLDDENLAITLPRRFGLSGVVDAQIRRYEKETRRGNRIPEPEVRDLIRLVSRRPDAERVLHAVGRSLTAAQVKPSWRRILPDRLGLEMARKRIRRRCKALFGGKFLLAPRGAFRLEAADDLLYEADPHGNACSLVTGLSQAVLEVYGAKQTKVIHVSCRARGDERCRWELGQADSAKGEANDSEAPQDHSGNGAPK